MRNALLLASIWVGILVVAYGLVYWDQGIDRPLPISILEEQVQFARGSYIQPDGLYSVTLPPGWSVDGQGAVVELVPPDDAIEVWIVQVTDDEAIELFAAAWSASPVDVAYQSLGTPTGPTGDAVFRGELTARYFIDIDDVVFAHAYPVDGLAVVLMARGGDAAFDAHTEDLREIESSLTAPASGDVTLL